MWDNEDLISNCGTSTNHGGGAFMTLPNESSKEEKEFKPYLSNLTFKSEMSNTFRGSKTFLPSIDPTLH